MANKIVLKKTSTASKVPLATDLDVGEIAVNLADQKLYSKNAGGTVILVGSGLGGSGDVSGPSSATDNAITRFNSTTGKLIQNSSVTIDDNGNTAGINAVTFDTTPSTVPATEGSLYWDNADGNQTLSLVMAGGTATQQIGEEIYYRIKASSAITEGQVVMFTGSVGASGALTGAPATGITVTTTTYVMGVATQDIANNGWGYITSFGLVRGLNTNAWTAGTILYLDPSVVGGLTSTIPTAPNPKVQVCAVVYQSATVGSLFIRPSFGGALGQFEGDVGFTSVAAGNLIRRNAGNTAWENVATIPNTNLANSSITINGSATALGGSVSVGTVTSVSGTAPISVATGTTTPAISISQATTSTNGYLSSTDWNTFNGKQAAGSYVTVGGALGTPSSGTLTNCTFPTLNQNTTGSSGSCTGNAATAGGFTPSQTIGVFNRIVVADANGYINNNFFNSSDNTVASGVSGVMVKQGDNYLRTGTAASIASFISGQTMNIAGSSTSCSGNAATATTATNFAGIPTGTAMLFQQTAAPTGWTKVTTNDNAALRVVSGTAGTGGTVGFTTAFASQAVSGSVATTGATTATNQATTAGGSVAATASTTAGGTVGATTLTTTQIPAHGHTYSGSTGTQSANHTHAITAHSGGGGIFSLNNNYGTSYNDYQGSESSGTESATHTHAFSGTTANAGSGGSHDHTFTGSGHTHTSGAFTGTSHNHTQDAHTHASGAFTGTAINLAVKYVDVIVATKG